jgi:hypothetical protein
VNNPDTGDKTLTSTTPCTATGTAPAACTATVLVPALTITQAAATTTPTSYPDEGEYS